MLYSREGGGGGRVEHSFYQFLFLFRWSVARGATPETNRCPLSANMRYTQCCFCLMGHKRREGVRVGTSHYDGFPEAF